MFINYIVTAVRQNSFLPQAYRLNENNRHRSGSKVKKNKRRHDSQGSKYSYDKQKQIDQKTEQLHKGSKF